jgi:hypothetical protein
LSKVGPALSPANQFSVAELVTQLDFNNHILRSKVNYQFSRELSLRAIFDYNARHSAAREPRP